MEQKTELTANPRLWYAAPLGHWGRNAALQPQAELRNPPGRVAAAIPYGMGLVLYHLRAAQMASSSTMKMENTSRWVRRGVPLAPAGKT